LTDTGERQVIPSAETVSTRPRRKCSQDKEMTAE